MLHPQLHSESHSYTQKNDFSCDKNRESKPKANDRTHAHHIHTQAYTTNLENNADSLGQFIKPTFLIRMFLTSQI